MGRNPICNVTDLVYTTIFLSCLENNLYFFHQKKSLSNTESDVLHDVSVEQRIPILDKSFGSILGQQAVKRGLR